MLISLSAHRSLRHRSWRRQGEKANLLRKALEEAGKQGADKSSKEYKELESRLQAAELAAQKAKKQFDEINQLDLERAKKELDNLKKKVDDAGDSMISAGKKASVLSAGVAAGMSLCVKGGHRL